MPAPAPTVPRPASLPPAALGVLLVAAVFLAYANVLTAPFLFDDLSAVVTNPTIRRFGTALAPPADGTSVTGRPLVNLSFALNHAVSGLQPWSYHALNIAIHASAALALFGLARRTLARHSDAGEAAALAVVLALLWALHPLQTESVSLVSQRTESLCGLFYLLALYAFARAMESATPRRWLAGSVAACFAGMASKEVAVTAPLLVLLYDRTFSSGSVSAAWQLRRGYYVALACAWLLLAWLVLGSGGTRGDAAGLGLGVSSWEYLLKQCEAVVLYLRLSVWPHPLIVDYGGAVVTSWTDVWWQGLVVLSLLAATAWALVRRPMAGFLGAWFFVILAPSSSFVPLVSQTVAEHRMYLPLAALLALSLQAVAARGGTRLTLGIGLVLGLAAGGLTFARNRVFHDELSLWTDTVAKAPANMRAHNNLGIALDEAGRAEEAAVHFQAAVRLAPHDADAQLNLCSVLVRLGRAAEALPHGEKAVALRPGSAGAQLNLAAALAALDRPAGAAVHYEEALRLDPQAVDVARPLAAAHRELGNRAAAAGDLDAAIARYRRAVELEPGQIAARNNLANALLMSGRLTEAIELYRAILRERPDDARVRGNLARALELTR